MRLQAIQALRLQILDRPCLLEQGLRLKVRYQMQGTQDVGRIVTCNLYRMLARRLHDELRRLAASPNHGQDRQDPEKNYRKYPHNALALIKRRNILALEPEQLAHVVAEEFCIVCYYEKELKQITTAPFGLLFSVPSIARALFFWRCIASFAAFL